SQSWTTFSDLAETSVLPSGEKARSQQGESPRRSRIVPRRATAPTGSGSPCRSVRGGGVPLRAGPAGGRGGQYARKPVAAADMAQPPRGGVGRGTPPRAPDTLPPPGRAVQESRGAAAEQQARDRGHPCCGDKRPTEQTAHPAVSERRVAGPGAPA